MKKHIILIDPSSEAYYLNQLFDNVALNRDDCLLPIRRLRQLAAAKNIEMHTADKFLNGEVQGLAVDYYSFGILKNYKKLANCNNVRLYGFFIYEPPVVQSALYKQLPELTQYFEKVYIHNIHGDGYSLQNVDVPRLEKLFWPQPYNNVLEKYWKNEQRLKKIVIINGNHCPASREGELYSRRIEAMCVLSQYDAIDLYGRGWDKWWSRSSLWLSYWKNRNGIMKIYKGACKSKYEILSHYDFSLCFENMEMDGYITEKLFDCLYAGAVPLYLGPKDVDKYIPKDVYVDCRKFDSWGNLWSFVSSISTSRVKEMRLAGAEFIRSDLFNIRYYKSLENAFDLGVK